MANRTYELQKKQTHYDVLSSLSLEEVARQTDLLLEDVGRLTKEGIGSGMTDMDLLKKTNQMLIKLDAFHDLDDIANYLDGSTNLRGRVSDFYHSLTSEARLANIERFDEASRIIKDSVSKMRNLRKTLEDIRKQRFAHMLANYGPDYEQYKRNEFKNQFIKKWIKDHGKKADARKDPNFKPEMEKWINDHIAAEMSSGDFQRNAVKWFSDQLKTAMFDTNFISVYMQAVQDNPDPITTQALMRYNQVFLAKEDEHRKFSIQLENLRSKLYAAKGHTSFTDPKDVYGFMIDFPDPGARLAAKSKLWNRNLKDTQAKLVKTPQQAYTSSLKELKA